MNNCTLNGNYHTIKGEYILNGLFENIVNSKIYNLNLEFQQMFCKDENDFDQKDCLYFIKSIDNSTINNVQFTLNNFYQVEGSDSSPSIIKNDAGTNIITNCLFQLNNANLINGKEYFMISTTEIGDNIQLKSNIQNNLIYIQLNISQYTNENYSKAFLTCSYNLNNVTNEFIVDLTGDQSIPSTIKKFDFSSQTNKKINIIQNQNFSYNDTTFINTEPKNITFNTGNTIQNTFQFGYYNVTFNIDTIQCEGYIDNNQQCTQYEDNLNQKPKNKDAIYLGIFIPITVLLLIVVIILIIMICNKGNNNDKNNKKDQKLQLKKQHSKKTKKTQNEIKMQDNQYENVLGQAQLEL